MKLKKTMVALVLLPAFVWLIAWGPYWGLLLVVLGLGAGLGGWEAARLVFGDQDPTFRMLATALSVACGAAAATGSDQWVAMALVGSGLVSLTVAGMASTLQTNALTRAAKLFFVALYPGLLVGYVAALRLYEISALAGTHLLIVLFLLIWVNDAGAFFVGSAFGKHKLAPSISPNKTWEGSLGGFAASVVAGIGVGMWSAHFTVLEGVLIGAVLGIVGPIGDLVESAFKRGAGVKDSGMFLPGHGGVLDRIDSIIVAAPVLYYYVVLAHYAKLVG
jgi:phosphatidate cytidylyltransferase